MGFTEQFTLSNDAVFQGRVKVAMAKVAVDVVGESQATTGNNTLAHRKRHALGVAILNDPDSYLANFTLATVTNAAITGASTDGDIEFQVSAVFSDIAGVGENLK